MDQGEKGIALALERRAGLQIDIAIIVRLASLDARMMMDAAVVTMQGDGGFLPIKTKMQMVATDARKQQCSAEEQNQRKGLATEHVHRPRIAEARRRAYFQPQTRPQFTDFSALGATPRLRACLQIA